MPAPEVRNPALVGATPPVRGRRSVHSGVGVHEAAHSARRVRHRTHMPMEPSAGPTRRTPRTVPLKLGSWRACPRAPLGTACTGGSARLGSAPGRSRTPHTGYGGPQEWNAGRERRANRPWEWTRSVLHSGVAPVPHDFVAHRAPAPAAPQDAGLAVEDPAAPVGQADAEDPPAGVADLVGEGAADPRLQALSKPGVVDAGTQPAADFPGDAPLHVDAGLPEEPVECLRRAQRVRAARGAGAAFGGLPDGQEQSDRGPARRARSPSGAGELPLTGLPTGRAERVPPSP
ncbi:hypothetical protein ACVWXB_000096 [Streptomyces sp. TE12347]